MVVGVSVEIGQLELAKAMVLLRAVPRGFSLAASRAVNKTSTRTRTAIIKGVRSQRPGLPLKAVRRNVTLRRATRRRLSATVGIGQWRIPLIDMAPNPRTAEQDLRRRTRRGVSYRAPGGGRKRVGQAFVAEMPSGHQGVFKRLTDKRNPIVELHGPSSAEIFNESEALARFVVAQTETNLAADLRTQVELLLRRAKR